MRGTWCAFLCVDDGASRMEIRLCGTSGQCERAVEVLKGAFDVLRVSGEYRNRDSEQVRVYVTVSDEVVRP